MKNNSRKPKLNTNNNNNTEVALFPRKIKIAIICAFIALVLAIAATGAYTLNMIFNPSLPKDTTQSK